MGGRRIKSRPGDVFLVPLDQNDAALGQVLASWKGELYIAIYDLKVPLSETNASLVCGREPLIAALSLDAKLWHGDWPIIGNVTSNLAGILHPVFKVGHNGSTYLVTRDRSVLRKALPEEASQLRLRTVYAPVALQNAILAHFGLGERLPRYEEFAYEYARRSSSLID